MNYLWFNICAIKVFKWFKKIIVGMLICCTREFLFEIESIDYWILSTSFIWVNIHGVSN